MGVLEDTLRATLSERVTNAPAVEDAAGRAIGTARRVRRRRAAIGAVAAVAAIFLIAAGTMAVRPSGGWSGGPEPVDVPTDTDLRLPVDVLAGNQILRAHDKRVLLDTLPPAVAAYRVPAGWLVVTHVNGSRWQKLWLVTPGLDTSFLREAQSFAVSPDGRRVAWGGGGGVAVAMLDGERLADARRSTGTGQLRPVGFAGTGVLLAAPEDKAGAARWDVWYPERGQYRPSAGPGPTAVYGVSGDGRTLYGAFDRAACLSTIDPDGMVRLRETCNVRVGHGYRVWLSPGGNRVLVGGEGLLMVYDAGMMWTDPQPLASWPVRATSATWLDNNTIVAGTVGSVTRLRVDRPYRQEESIYLGGTDGQQPIVVVPDLDD